VSLATIWHVVCVGIIELPRVVLTALVAPRLSAPGGWSLSLHYKAAYYDNDLTMYIRLSV